MNLLSTCDVCKKRYQPWITINDNVYNIDLINHFAFICIDCYERKRKMTQLEDNISTLKFKIQECKKDMKHYKSSLKNKNEELCGLEWREWANS